MRRRLSILLLAAAVFITALYPAASADESSSADTPVSVYTRLPYFSTVYGEYPEEYPENAVEIPVSDGKSAGSPLKAAGAMPNTSGGAVKSEQAAGDITWKTAIKESGRYIIKIGYQVTSDSGNNAVRSLLIDNETPFYEAEKIVFYRAWEDSGAIIKNNIGDEVRPGVAKKKGWQICELRDSSGFYASPLVFYLTAGEHSITLKYISQDMNIGSLTLEPYKPVESYRDAAEQSGSAGNSGFLEAFQAEKSASVKNDATIRIESNGDPETKPISYGERVFNTLGGYRWRKGNQSVIFELDAPEDGYYKIAFRFNQVWNDGIPSYRTIKVNGEIPFSEVAAYPFKHSGSWQTEVLGGEDPYLFYLKKGSNQIEMTVTLGELTPIIQSLYDDMALISDFMQDISKLTGAKPDPDYDYQFFRYIPTLEGDMRGLVTSLRQKIDMLEALSGRSTSVGSNFKSIVRQLESMLKNPFSIAGRVNQINQMQTSLGTWYLEIQNQPLQLDEIIIASSEMQVAHRKSNLFQRIRSAFKSFILSFTRDYTNMASTLGDDVEIRDTIDIWLSRGTEWAEIMKGMADESFTSKTGILVNINVVPSTQLNTGSANALLLSIVSGNAPDAAIGITANSPVEFAIRGAVTDIGQFSDFGDVKERFLPDIFVPFEYGGGVYAVPETMNFTCLFYRKDIFSRLGIQIPDTREQLYDDVLPILYQNGLSYYQSRDFTQFLFQHGGRFYKDGGTKSALDSPEAYTAFREFTEMFTSYGVDLNANFFSRFRTGEMPMGIGDFALYLQLSTAAPELAGKWGIAPLPGIRKEDGVINRACGGLAGECAIILKDGNERSAWEFLKWWTSTDVQREYSREIEALIGVESRWNSANIKAFESLEWSWGDLDVFREQFKWATETPVVLGGYFSARHITNAFTSAVISSDENPRDALENAVKEINRELRQKQEEYSSLK